MRVLELEARRTWLSIPSQLYRFSSRLDASNFKTSGLFVSNIQSLNHQYTGEVRVDIDANGVFNNSRDGIGVWRSLRPSRGRLYLVRPTEDLTQADAQWQHHQGCVWKGALERTYRS